jgi:hypothetical protein
MKNKEFLTVFLLLVLVSGRARAGIGTPVNISLPPPLLKLAAVTEQYAEDKISIQQYLEYIVASGQQLDPFPNLSLFYEQSHLENFTNPKLIRQDQNNLVRILREKSDEIALMNLAEYALAFRAGRIGPAQFYGMVREMAEIHHVSLEAIPSYVEVLKGCGKIDVRSIPGELTDLENQALFRLAENHAQKDFIRKHFFGKECPLGRECPERQYPSGELFAKGDCVGGLSRP